MKERHPCDSKKQSPCKSAMVMPKTKIEVLGTDMPGGEVVIELKFPNKITLRILYKKNKNEIIGIAQMPKRKPLGTFTVNGKISKLTIKKGKSRSIS